MGAKGDVWTEEIITEMIAEYNVDTVRRISYLGVTTPPKQVRDFFETDQYKQVETTIIEESYF